MQIKHGLLLVILSIATPSVQADIEIYGSANAGIASVNDGGDDGSLLSIESYKSRLGFRGAEQIGKQQLIWQIENGIDLSTGTNSTATDSFGLTARDTYLGIRAGWGELRAGKINTPYKTSTKDLDIFIDTHADYNAVIGRIHTANGASLEFDNRLSNTLRYDSPGIHNLQLHAAYSADTTRDVLSQDATSVALTLDAGPVYLAAAQEVFSEPVASGIDKTGTKFGIGYRIGQSFKTALVWEDIDLGSTGDDRMAFYLNLLYQSNKNSFKFGYGLLDSLSGTDNTGADHFAFGYSRAFAKNYELYVLYAATQNESAGLNGLDLVPVPGGPRIASAIGEDVTAFTVGIIYKFNNR